MRATPSAIGAGCKGGVGRTSGGGDVGETDGRTSGGAGGAITCAVGSGGGGDCVEGGGEYVGDAGAAGDRVLLPKIVTATPSIGAIDSNS